MERLKGEIKTVTFRSIENGYSVVKVVPGQKSLGRLVTVVGILPGLEAGDEMELYGVWGKHEKFGRQFEAETYQIILPTSIDGLKTYLEAHIKGIGPVYAKKIVDKFGENTTRILESEPGKLAKIRGLTKSKAAEIGQAWRKDAAVRSQLIKLSALGISPKLALKIINQYGDAAHQTIKDHPYQLAEDIWGVGFIKADKIAHKLGFTADHPTRISAAIIHILQKALENGHLFLPQNELVEKTQELVGSKQEKIIAIINQQLKQKSLVSDQGDAVYLSLYHHLEQKLAEMIHKHQQQPKPAQQDKPHSINFAKAFPGVTQKQGFSLNTGQQEAIKSALLNPISILTGGPGTGKSTTLNALVKIFRAKDKTVTLAAPTGRAAKRMTELTDYEAKTIHRTLKIDKSGNAFYNQDNPLPVDFLVVDEASMLDIIIAYRVVSALSPYTHLLLVGDDNQLPSVQAGNVLADLIQSGTVPVVHLTEIFRQARQSAIIRNAHKINAGHFPEFPNHPTDFYFFKEEDAEAAADLIVDLVSQRIPQNFNLDPLRDIQVLAPLHKTACGVGVLNTKLQTLLNPKTVAISEISAGYQVYRVNDRVMQTVNNYEKEVFNGEIGIISRIDISDEKSLLIVDYDGRTVVYKQDELNQITLAYAVSVHKSQGSEYPAIVMPILTSHYIMLARNLLYTAVTRAKQLVVLVGSKKAIGIAVNNNKAAKRYTLLSRRLQDISK